MAELAFRSLMETWALLVAAAPWLLLGFLAAGMLHVFLPTALLSRWLGPGARFGALRAALVGAPLPLCSCAVVPVAAALRRGGASPGATTAFLISTPETGVDSIAVTYALMDPLMTIARPVSAISTALVGGALAEALGSDRSDAALARPRACCAGTAAPPAASGSESAAPAAGCCSTGNLEAPSGSVAERSARVAGSPRASTALAVLNADAVNTGGLHTGTLAISTETQAASMSRAMPDHWLRPASALLVKFGRGVRYAAIDMFVDLGPYLAVGFVLGGVLAAVLGAWLPLQSILHSPFAPLLMLVAGMPLYVCASSSTPIVAALVAQGLSPGAGLVFLLAGPATNAATLALVRSILGGRGLAAYLGSIAGCALLAGYALDALYALSGIAPRAVSADHEHHGSADVFGLVAAAALLMLIVAGIARRIAQDRAAGATAR